MNIGEFLAYRRKQLGLSLSDVGSVIGYTPQAIYRYEKGIVKIDLSLVDSFCRVLDLSLESFFKMDPKAISSYQNEKFIQNAFCTLLQSELEREPGIVHKIAAELNVSTSRVEKWCNGISLPSVGDFIVLSNILGYQPTDLYWLCNFYGGLGWFCEKQPTKTITIRWLSEQGIQTGALFIFSRSTS